MAAALCPAPPPLARSAARRRLLRSTACAAEATPSGAESDDGRVASDFRSLRRLQETAGAPLAAASAGGLLGAASLQLTAAEPRPQPRDKKLSVARLQTRTRRAALFRKRGGEVSDAAETQSLNSSQAAERVPWRSRYSAAPFSAPETQERLAWQLQLTLACKLRNAERARALLAEMTDAGCLPGPQEYHLAVAAHALQGSVDGMLEVLNEQHRHGGRALLQTYKAVIRACACAGEPELAVEAQTAATRAGYDDHDSWRTLCNSLFAVQASREAFEAVEMGKARGHVPAEDTALYMLRFLGERGSAPEATNVWHQFQAWGLRLTSEHYNAYMESMIYTFGMRNTLQMQIVGTVLPGLDTEGVNMVLDALASHPSQLGDTGEAWNPSMLLRQLETNLEEQGCQPDALTHVLALDCACAMGEFELAMHHFRRLEQRGDVAQLSEERVAVFLSGLSGSGRGEDLLHVLTALRNEQLPLPACEPDSLGHTLSTSWLAADRAVSRELGMSYFRREREERTARTAANREERRAWKGPRLVMPPLSKLKVPELRAEAASLGLEAEGSRKEVYARIRGAREEIKEGIASPDLLAAAQALYEEDEAEGGRQSAAAKRARRSEFGEEVDDEEDEDDVAPTQQRYSSKPALPVGPLIAASPWRKLELLPSDALSLALAICDVLGSIGLVPTQGDLIAMAREAVRAADAAAARQLLQSAAAAPGGACVQLYILAAEAAVAAGDLLAAVRVVDEADLAGIVIPASAVQSLLAGSGRDGTLGAASIADDFRLPPQQASKLTAVPVLA